MNENEPRVPAGSPAGGEWTGEGGTPARMIAEGSHQKNIAADIATMMAGWNKIETAAKAQFPHADKDELYQICKGAMNHALGLK